MANCLLLLGALDKTREPNRDGPINQGFKKTVAFLRFSQGRSTRTSFLILDAQSVKNTDTAENSGYDGGKKIKSIKRTLAVDNQGLPQGIHVTTGDVSDRDAASSLLMLHADQFDLVQRIMVDGGYTGDKFASLVGNSIGADVIIAKQSDLKHGHVTPQRWVIERSFGWLEKCRRLWKNCERKLHTSTMMITLAFLRFMLKRH